MSTEIQEYTQTEAALADLRSRYDGVVWEVATTKGMDAAKKARAEVRGYRSSLENMRKEIKAPALERCRLIDEEAKRITAELVKLEGPIDEVIKAEESRKEAEKAERERIERERIGAIRIKIAQIVILPSRFISCRSTDIEAAILALKLPTLDDFAEFTGEALQAHADAVQKMDAMLAATKIHEAEAERLEAERQALAEAKAKAEAEAAERRRQEEAAAAEQRRIEAEKLAAERAAQQRLLDEQRAELARQRREQEEAAAAAMVEQERQAAIQREEIRKQQAELAAQQKALDDARRKAEAEAQAAREAEEAAAIAKAEAEHQARIAEYALKAQLAAAAHAARLAGRPSDDMIIDALCETFKADRLTVIAWLEDMKLDPAEAEEAA